MKTLKSILVYFVVACFLLGCSSDDSSISNIDDVSEITDNTEDDTDDENSENNSTSASSNELSDKIIIAGSTKLQGLPPTSNGTLSLDLTEAGSKAFINEGFDIPINSDGDIVGAYVHFRVKDSIAADSYYDIDIVENATEKKKLQLRNKNSKFFNKDKILAKVLESDAIINIDFNPELTSGELCYTIAIYDNQGNISEAKEICLAILAWGGNNDLVANWSLVSSEETYEGQTSTQNVGQEYCDEGTSDVYCYTMDFGRLHLNMDGTFFYEQRYDEREATGSYSENSWTIATIYGNWVYDQNDNKLILFEYRFTVEDTNGIDYEEVQDPGNAYVYFTESISVNSTNLTIVYDSADYDGDGNVDESYQENYEKQ